MIFSTAWADSFMMVDFDFFSRKDGLRLLSSLGDEWLITSNLSEGEWGSAAMLLLDDLLMLLNCFDQNLLNSSKVIEQKLLLGPNFWTLINSLKTTTKPMVQGSNFKFLC